jgi:hypothetical protein
MHPRSPTPFRSLENSSIAITAAIINMNAQKIAESEGLSLLDNPLVFVVRTDPNQITVSLAITASAG